ncbi:hypothetical protein ACA910_009428 [Epithemia clementina (nom. ined.)]
MRFCRWCSCAVIAIAFNARALFVRGAQEDALACEGVDLDGLMSMDLDSRLVAQEQIGYGTFPILLSGLPGIKGLKARFSNEAAARSFQKNAFRNFFKKVKGRNICPVFQEDLIYFLDMLLLGECGYVPFFHTYDSLTSGAPFTAPTPGLCTTAYFSHSDIKSKQTIMPKKFENRVAIRGNELGLFRLNPRLFPDCGGESANCGYGLGATAEIHALMRPFLDYVFGDGLYPFDKFVNTGPVWNRDDLVASAKAHLEGKNVVEVGTDASLWVIKELHSLTLGLSLSEVQAKNFVDLQGANLLLAIVPDSVVGVIESILGTTVEQVTSAKEALVQKYMAILSANSNLAGGTIDVTDQLQLRVAGTALLNSFLMAGGLSVPSSINNAAASYFAVLTDANFDPTNPLSLKLLVLEAIRMYPPVLGFPYIEKSGQRMAPLVGMAGTDKGVYGDDALEFRIRGDLTYYHTRSLNFADAAVPKNEGNSIRSCPARSLAVAMSSAFLEALELADSNGDPQWCVVGGPESLVLSTGPTFWEDFSIEKCTD